jgi:hypothetical protein
MIRRSSLGKSSRQHIRFSSGCARTRGVSFSRRQITRHMHMRTRQINSLFTARRERHSRIIRIIARASMVLVCEKRCIRTDRGVCIYIYLRISFFFVSGHAILSRHLEHMQVAWNDHSSVTFSLCNAAAYRLTMHGTIGSRTRLMY